MRAVLAAAALCAAVSIAAPAQAHNYYHHHFHRHHYHQVRSKRRHLRRYSRRPYHERTHRSDLAGHDRPRDCYGIPWCGCFLRHYFGLADRALNLARNWIHVGRATTPHAGAIVVWPHHVGVLKSDEHNGRAVVLSGNDGNRVRTRELSLRGAIAFREL